jgi:hypothetical protein
MTALLADLDSPSISVRFCTAAPDAPYRGSGDTGSEPYNVPMQLLC